LDIGAGASRLAESLAADGWPDVTVLDLSVQALDLVRSRLGLARGVSFVVADLLSWRPDRRFVAWHDRAVFHFLTGSEQQQQYVRIAAEAVAHDGALVLGVFAEDGPTQCSGLATCRYDALTLAELFAPDFTLESTEREEHVTPTGSIQPFTWVVLRRA
jgi:SAM-dependent methyltransferase